MLSPNPLGSADDAASLKVLAQTKTSAALFGSLGQLCQATDLRRAHNPKERINAAPGRDPDRRSARRLCAAGRLVSKRRSNSMRTRHPDP